MTSHKGTASKVRTVHHNAPYTGTAIRYITVLQIDCHLVTFYPELMADIHVHVLIEII